LREYDEIEYATWKEQLAETRKTKVYYLRGPKRRGRPRTPVWAIYEKAAAHKEAHGDSWHQLAKRFFLKDYKDNPHGCSDRVRMGVMRVKQAKRS